MRNYNIPIFVPHKGCPHDCVFCNQRRITAQAEPATPQGADAVICQALSTIDQNGARVEIAFFGGSFTAIDRKSQQGLLKVAQKYLLDGRVQGIRISTRPDCIDEGILTMLKEYGVTTIELGVQSLDDEVLSLSGRGHDAACVAGAVALIKRYGFALGLQMMVGLPGDSQTKSLATAAKIIGYRPDGVRIYPTVVIADSVLCERYQQGEYSPLTVEAAVEICARLKLMFDEAHIPVIRMGLMSGEGMELGESIIAGPYHPAFGELVKSRLFLDKALDFLNSCKEERAVLRVNPKELSQAIGNKKSNLQRIKQITGIEISFAADKRVEQGGIMW